MKKLWYLTMMFISSLATVFVIYASYLTFYPFKVITFKNPQNLPVDKHLYVAGEQIAITFDYQKFMDIAPKTKKEIVCDRSVTDLSELRRLPKGKDVVKLSHTIPLATPTDNHCRIYIFLEYKPNVLQTVPMTLRTAEFAVINEKL